MGVCQTKHSSSQKLNKERIILLNINFESCTQALQIYHKFNNLMELIGDITSLPEENKTQLKILNMARNSMMVMAFKVENHCDGYSKENFALKGLNLFEDQMRLIYKTLEKLEQTHEFYVCFPILSVSFQGIIEDIDRYFQRSTVILTPLDQSNQSVKKNIFENFKKPLELQNSHSLQRKRSQTLNNFLKS